MSFEEWWEGDIRKIRTLQSPKEYAQSIWLAATAVERKRCADFVSKLVVFGSCELQERQCNTLRDNIAKAIQEEL